MMRLILLFFVLMQSTHAAVIPSVGLHGPSRTTYIGSNEKDYLVKGIGGHIDDGIFVAIKDGGPYEGYSYYELPFNYTGAVTGWATALPTKGIDGYPVSGRIGISYNSPHILSVNRGTLPKFPIGGIIPKGSKFFHWISGRGEYYIPESYMELIDTVDTEISLQAVPKEDAELWYDFSDILKETVKKRI